VRIDEVSILIDRADAVRIAVRNQPRLTLLLDHDLLARANVRLNGLRVDPRKQRIMIRADLYVLDTHARKDSRQNARARAVHTVDGQLEPRLRNQFQIDEALDGLDVGRQEIDQLNFRRRS